MTIEIGFTSKELVRVVAWMRAWADAHPECDTQGIMDDEWEGLAGAAIQGLRAS